MNTSKLSLSSVLNVNLQYIIAFNHISWSHGQSRSDVSFGSFNSYVSTEGYVDENSRGHCISPLLYETGWVPVQISSDNGTTFSSDGAWLSGTITVCSLLLIYS